VGCRSWVVVWGSGACSSPVSRVWTGPGGGCRSSLRCARRHGALRQVRSVGVNQRGRPRQGGGHDQHDPPPTAVGGRSCVDLVRPQPRRLRDAPAWAGGCEVACVGTSATQRGLSRPLHGATARPRAEWGADPAITPKCPCAGSAQLRRRLIPPRGCVQPTPRAYTATCTLSLAGHGRFRLLCKVWRRNQITVSNGPHPEHDSRGSDAPVMHQLAELRKRTSERGDMALRRRGLSQRRKALGSLRVTR
jgi:hypothetical protein